MMIEWRSQISIKLTSNRSSWNFTKWIFLSQLGHLLMFNDISISFPFKMSFTCLFKMEERNENSSFMKSEWKINTQSKRGRSDSLKYVVRIFIYLFFSVISKPHFILSKILSVIRTYKKKFPSIFFPPYSWSKSPHDSYFRKSLTLSRNDTLNLSFCEFLSYIIVVWPLVWN